MIPPVHEESVFPEQSFAKYVSIPVLLSACRQQFMGTVTLHTKNQFLQNSSFILVIFSALNQ